MKTKENELLIIQTSDSSSVFIIKDLFPYDDPDLEQICYSISEGYNPLYWSDDCHNDLQEVINLIEFPKKMFRAKETILAGGLIVDLHL